MASEKELEKIGLLLQEVSDNECNNIDESSESESDICEQVLENSDTEQSDNSDDDDLTLSDQADVMIGKDKTTIWKKAVVSKNIRTRIQNIVNRSPGPKLIAKQMKSSLNCFNLLVNNVILN
jgi:hypothetical protein